MMYSAECWLFTVATLFAALVPQARLPAVEPPARDAHGDPLPPGAVARLYSWADISGNVKSIKALEVDCVTSATIGQWSDTLITATENQLHARTDYAVLGYEASVAVVTVAIKGQETGNLRVGGPGPTSSFPTSDYFVQMSNMHGTPHIPVFNADNRNSVYVSTAANTASVATKVTLILAEMATALS